MPEPQQFAAAIEGLSLTGRDPVSVRRRVEALELLLERSLTIPGINRPVGLDAVVGLIPGIGDFIAAALGGYIIWEARNLGMSKWQLARMTGHVGFDTLVGLVPFAGDAFDFFYRSNSRNLKIIKRHLDKHHPETMTIEGSAAVVEPITARVQHRL